MSHSEAHKMNTFIEFTRIFFLLFNCVICERIINTPIVTTFGSWQEWEDCPNGTYVTGMDLFTDELPTLRGIKDKTGVLSAVFQCSYPRTPTIPEDFIFSQVKGVNNSVFNWDKKSRKDEETCIEVVHSLPLKASCEGIVTAVEVMNHEKQLALDNTGAANLRIYCSDMAEEEIGYIEGYGIYEGDWTSPVSCGSRKGICGLQTLSQDLNKSMDESAVNAFRFKCCDIPNPAKECEPQELWELVQECSNAGNSTPAFTCAYVRKTGVASAATGPDIDPLERNFYETIGYGLASSHLMLNALKNNFASKLKNSALVDALDWSATGLEIWVDENSEDVTYYSIPTGKSVKIFQLVGTCSYFSVRTPIIKQVSF